MRPAVMLAMENEKLPDHRVTVFAGQDLEATAELRKFLVGYPPSSPAIALMKGGEVVYMMERFRIEGRSAEEIATDLKSVFDENC